MGTCRAVGQSLALWVVRQLAQLQAVILLMTFGEPIWISADGRVTPYSQLDDQHLRNILRMMRRGGQRDQLAFARLAALADARGVRW